MALKMTAVKSNIDNRSMTLEWSVTPFIRPGPEVIKLFSSSTQLSMELELLINIQNL